MTKRNETLNIDYRFLSKAEFSVVHRTLLDAFSDYIVPMKLSEIQFKNHIAQNAVDLNLSVGAFAGEKMIGYTLNGFGIWNEKSTAYDAGTGVIPQFRSKGIGKAMFDFLIPKLKDLNIEQMLLEVIETNENAVKLYKKIGFEISRKLVFFEQPEDCKFNPHKSIEVREIENPDWDFLKTFWDGNTSWQFSSESIERKLLPKTVLSAFLDKKCVGYGVVYPNSGVIAQIAVDKNHRKKGIGSALLAEFAARIQEDKSLKFSNVDFSLKELTGFVERLKFKRTLTQLEMIKVL